MDRVQDQLARGRKLRALSSLASRLRWRYGSFLRAEAVEALARDCKELGVPAAIRVSRGNQLVSRDLDLRAYLRDVMLTSLAVRRR